MDETSPGRDTLRGTARGLGLRDTLDRYEILEEIGFGGMGVVYRARDPVLGREVALKLVRADLLADARVSRARLLREAQAMARVSHPNVLPIYDVGEVDDDVFIAMEYVDGASLPRWLDAEPRPPEAILDAFIDVARGLLAVHGVGLVHRDLKPSNVLVDGRARVMDFGLARGAGVPTDDGPSPPGPLLDRPVPRGAISTQITQAGTVLGTPAYMAPEQMVAEGEIDERADQYSFCVALFEALFGVRPFGATTMMELAREKLGHQLVEVELSSPLRRSVHAILHRGLAPRPEDRWPSMRAVLEGLEGIRTPPRRRGRWLWAGGATVAGAALWLGLASTEDPCETEDPLTAVWNETERDAVRQAWEATEAPYWEAAWATVEPRLEAFAHDWRAQRLEVCHANRSPQGHDASLLDRRTRCLDARLGHFDALVDTLQRSEPAVVQGAAGRVADLPRVEPCADPGHLAAHEPAPDGARRAQQVSDLRAALVVNRAKLHTGREDEVLATAQSLEQRAAALGFPPVHAEALLELARAWTGVGDDSAVSEAGTRGYLIAIEAGHDVAALDIAIMMITTARMLAQLEQSMQWSRRSEALLDANQDDPPRRARQMQAAAIVLTDLGRESEAIALLQGALAIQRESLGSDHPHTAETLLFLGTALRSSPGRIDDCLDVLQQAVEAAEAAFDPSHPKVASFENGLGNALVVAGRLGEALAHYDRALALMRAAHGDGHRNVAGMLLSRSHVFIAREQYAEAEAGLTEALAIWERAYGPEHPTLALALNNLGVVYEGLGDDPRALSNYRRALELQLQAYGPAHPMVAAGHRNVGEAHIRLEQLTEAAVHFEQVLQLARDGTVDPDDVAVAHFGRARVMWPADPPAARAEAEAAHAMLVELGVPALGHAEIVEEWLEQHPVP